MQGSTYKRSYLNFLLYVYLITYFNVVNSADYNLGQSCVKKINATK